MSGINSRVSRSQRSLAHVCTQQGFAFSHVSSDLGHEVDQGKPQHQCATSRSRASTAEVRAPSLKASGYKTHPHSCVNHSSCSEYDDCICLVTDCSNLISIEPAAAAAAAAADESVVGLVWQQLQWGVWELTCACVLSIQARWASFQKSSSL